MKVIFTFLFFLVIVGIGFGQTTTIDFETAGAGYTPSTTFGSGNTDVFNRTNTSINGNSTYHWAAEDINGNPSISLSQIDITGATSFTFAIDLSYDNAGAWDATDEFIITYSTDGGSNYTNLLAVQHINSDGYNNPAALDLDFDGNGDPGHELSTSTFNTYTTSSISLSSKTTLDIKLQFNNLTSNGEGILIDNIVITQSSGAANSNDSKITKTPSWSEPTNIAYTSYDAANTLTTANSLEIASFTIVDGDGSTADADAVSTKLTDLSVDIDNWSNVKAIAIFDGTTNVGEITTMAATVSFSSLTIEALDDGTKDFTLRATFDTYQTDNQNIKYTISAATADNAGSIFAAADAGAATTDNTGNNNKIVVTADRVKVMENMQSVQVNQDFGLDIFAVDINNNTDEDATQSVTLAISTGSGSLSSATGTTQSFANGMYSWFDLQYDVIGDFKIEGQCASLTNGLSALMTAFGDSESDIIKASGWSEPTNIAYTTYSASSGLTTANSIEVAKFTIRDGGSDNTDNDAASTKVTDLEINIPNYSIIAAVALFDGSTNIAEVTNISGSNIAFNSISAGITAADNSTKDFSVYMTFKTAVTDNDNFQITISSVTAASTGSGFAEYHGGGAATDNSGDNNKIEVTADRLDFTIDKPTNSVTNATNFDVEVEAIDINKNRDLDATNSITLVKATGTGILSSATGLTQSLSSGVYSWTDVQYDTEEDFTIEAQTASLTNITSSTITCAAPSVAPAVDSLYISEVSEGPNYVSEFLELYNPSITAIDLSNVSIVRMSGSSVEEIKALADFAGDLTVPAKGYLVISRGADRAAFESDWPSFPSTAKFIQGNDKLYFATSTARRWRITYDDGAKAVTTIDDSQNTVAGSGNTSNQTTPGNWTTTSYSGNSSPGARNANSELPIQLISFTAKANSNFINLKWQTATETNNDFFSIERSYNAKDFEELGIVSGAGNSNTKQYYKYLDKSANLQNTIYYRLKQTDYDGKYTYSKIISVNGQTSHWELINSYVNDKKLILTINSTFVDNSSLEVMDVSGRIVLRKEINMQKGINTYRIDLNRYSNGLYFVRIVNNANKTVANTKLILK